MNTYKYMPYYQYNGPTIDNPLREELSLEDQERNKLFFYTDVENYFEDDSSASVYKEKDGTVVINTILPKEECDKIVADLLRALDLLAKKI